MPGRIARWVRGELPYCLVLATFVVSLGYLIVDSGRWGRTSGGIGVGLLLAAALRGIVPGDRVGMLAVRGRVLDTVVYLVLGAAVLGIDIMLHR